ncbi:MAG: glycosyltransferase [Firmicutes bacterium]|nr:glycosyltransferase [Candidatus Colimorpha enterica]
MPELSIIIPVYKTEKYLRRCLDSVLNQTFSDFELILIDDGSPDNCGMICDEYKEKDGRITVLHTENRGVSAARNAGIARSTGNFIGFVDSDDFVSPDMYEKMVAAAHTAHESGALLVACGTNYLTDGLEPFRSEIPDNTVLDADGLIRAVFATPNPLGGGVCNKLFYGGAIRKIAFSEEIKLAEDWLFLCEYSLLADKCVCVCEWLYNVVARPDSTTRGDDVDAYYRMVTEGKTAVYKRSASYPHDVRCLAADKYLDDCIRYSNLIRESGKNSGRKWRGKFLKVRLIVLKEIPSALFSRLVPLGKAVRYAYSAFFA